MNLRVLLMSLMRRGNLDKLYQRNLRHQYAGNEEIIKREMRENAMNIFKFHVQHNPEYRRFLTDKHFDFKDLDHIVWEDIPIITKDDLKKYYPEVKSEVYNYSASGGSTNVPFKYPASKESALNIWPAHWLMYEMCGGHPYDNMLMLMAYGNAKKTLTKKVYHGLSNFHTFNAFTMTEEQMYEMCDCIHKKHLRFIYGYSSAINQFLRFLKDKNIKLQLKGIFTTSDNRIMSSYSLAREYCNCEVYNQYGAHDGDVFTFECKEHNGLHILHDMCTMEIVNHNIIVTAVKNRAFPFIRYKVGDIAEGEELITEKCKCGRTLFRLKGISGRNTYFIQDSDGNEVSVMLFTYPFDDDPKVLQYQVLEEDGRLYVNIITDDYTVEDLNRLFMPFIKKRVKREVQFVINQPLLKNKNGKTLLFYKKS